MTYGFSHYELLGVAPSAGAPSIEARIRALRIQRTGSVADQFVLWLHGIDADALEQARTDLLDAQRRCTYDAELHRSRRWPPPYGPTL